MSSVELSVDISALVKRSLAGESIDMALEGESLAVKYPGLDMSGELIAKAISRTAAMMGVVLEDWDSAPVRDPSSPVLGGYGHNLLDGLPGSLTPS